MRTGLNTVFGSLKVRNFRLFTAGQLVKLVGVWAQFTAQDWLVLQLTDNSATALGYVTALQFVPVLLLTLFGGKLADRHDKRVLLIWVNAIFAVSTCVLGALVVTGAVALWHIFVFAGITGIINSIENPTRQSFVSELVAIPLLPNALALSAATFNSARVLGPALAGVAIDQIGLGPVFIADAFLCTAPLFSLMRVRPAELLIEENPGDETPEARIIDGLAYVWRRPDLILPMALIAVVGMFGFNFQMTLALMAKTVFHANAQTFGLLTTALAIGALGGALASTGRRARPSTAIVLAAALAFGVLETIVAFSPSFLVAMLLLLPTGFSMVYFAQASNQRVQLATEGAFRGRVMALYGLVFMGTTPIGAPIIGWCAEHLGPRSGIWIGGVVTLVAALVASVVYLRSQRAQEENAIVLDDAVAA